MEAPTKTRPSSTTTMLKVVILGDGGVGKSCLMHRFVANRFDDQSFHTIGVEFLNKELELDGRRFTLQIWDTAGQERFRSLRTPFYRGSDICLLTYAVDDAASFDRLQSWLDEFALYADVRPDGDFPFVVVGNKADRAEAREVPAERAQEWCAQRRIACHCETSAKTARNVARAFAMAVERWIALEKANEKDLRKLTHVDTVNLNKLSRRKKGLNPCCAGTCSIGE